MDVTAKHRLTGKNHSILYNYWVHEFVNKGTAHDYIILSYPDLVQVRTIEPNTSRLNYKILERPKAQELIDKNPSAFDFIEINIDQLKSNDNSKSKIISEVLKAYKPHEKENITFEEFFTKYFKKKTTREYARELLNTVYKNGLIETLPSDLNIENKKEKQEKKKNSRQLNNSKRFSFLKNVGTGEWILIGLTIISITLFIIFSS